MIDEDQEIRDPMMAVKGLYKSFGNGDDRLDVLKGIDLVVHPAETVTIVGASGVGKSTLLHIMGALDRPTSGAVLYEGEELFGKSDAELAAFRNREIGFVFQFHHLLPEFSALENVAMPALIHGMGRQAAEDRAAKMLEAVGLADRARHRPGELSGGERQRVAISRALVLRPRLLLADEPTGNLDTRTGEAVHDLLVEFNRTLGVTLVVVTHNLSLAERMGRRLSMVDGRISEGD